MKISKEYLKKVIMEELEQEAGIKTGVAAGVAATMISLPAISALVTSYRKFETEAKAKVQQLQKQNVDIIGAIQKLKDDHGALISDTEIRQLSLRGKGKTINPAPYMRFLELAGQIELSDEQIAKILNPQK
jgi:hypothetical protein